MTFDYSTVETILITQGVIDPDMEWVVQTGGRSNLVWHLLGARDLVVKLYDTQMENPLYANSPTAEYECLRALTGMGIGPEPVVLLNTDVGQVLVYHYLKGTVWSQDVKPVAPLLERVWNVPPIANIRAVGTGADALVSDGLGILELLPDDVAQPYRNAQPTSVSCDPITPRFIHTDVVAGNLINTAQGLCLIDWQCPAMGDPTTDIAMFLSPAMQMIYGTELLPKDQVDLFLDGFSDQSRVERYLKLAPLYHWRMAIYCAWRAARGDAGYADAAKVELAVLN